MIVAGHSRLAAAKPLGLTEVPVVVLGHLTEAGRHAYTMADNRTALNSTWDDQLRAREMAFLQQAGAIELDLIGFSKKEIERLLKGANGGAAGRTEPNAVQPVAKDPVSRLGDTWLLGGYHRLRNGHPPTPRTSRRCWTAKSPT